MLDPHTNFDYPTIIDRLLSYELLNLMTSDIGNSHCALSHVIRENSVYPIVKATKLTAHVQYHVTCA